MEQSAQKIIDALNEAIKKQGLSERKLAELAGLDQKKVNRMLRGETKRLDIHAVSRLRLALGLDSPPPSDMWDTGASRPADAFDIPRPVGKIPIVSWAQAGPAGYFEDAFPAGSGFGEVNRPFDVTDPEAYALIISGDSMSPKYEPGDLIVVSPNMGVQNGDYAVVRLKDGTVAAKRVKEKDDRFLLESVNPEFPPRECKKEDVVFTHRIVWVKQRG